jgi:GTP-binding protein
VTRDIVAVDLANGATLLDTGGLGLNDGETPAELRIAVEEQVDFAIAMADRILLVLDGKCGLLPQDLEIAMLLRQKGKCVTPVVNKVDSGDLENAAYVAAPLGFTEKTFAISAEHNRGIDCLEAEIFKNLPELNNGTESLLSMAFMGAPNVGKSSLANALLGARRMIVSATAGTTRDAVSGDFTFIAEDGGQYPMRIVDTAGLRAEGKMNSSVEYFASVRARSAMESVDVVFLVLDAVRGLTKFDKKIVAETQAAGKNLAIVVNKWDLAERAVAGGALPNYDDLTTFRSSFEDALRRELFAWPQIPILFLSAQTGENVRAIGSTALRLRERSTQKITTGALNRFIGTCLDERPPAQKNGKAFKLFYALQVSVAPIAIRLYCNAQKLLEDNYEAYLRRRIIGQFDLGGCPLRLTYISKPIRGHVANEKI